MNLTIPEDNFGGIFGHRISVRNKWMGVLLIDLPRFPPRRLLRAPGYNKFHMQLNSRHRLPFQVSPSVSLRGPLLAMAMPILYRRAV